MRRTRSQIRAAQIAALAAEQEAYDKSVKEAMKVASFARCDAVEQLYELLEVKPEQPNTRAGKNGAYEVATDKDETKRTARLVDAVTALVSALESSLQLVAPVDHGGVTSRWSEQDRATQQQQFASVPNSQPAGALVAR